MADEFLSLREGIGGVALRDEEFGKGLEAFFFGDGGAGAFLRAEGEINIFERGDGVGRVDGFFKGGREEVALLQRGEDGARRSSTWAICSRRSRMVVI